MRRRLAIISVVIAILVVLISGCSSKEASSTGANEDEVASLQARIETLENKVAILSTIAAYQIWYDQYHASGIYQFPSAESFVATFGTLVEASSDNASEAAWNDYLIAERNCESVSAGLPEDSATWSENQSDEWAQTTDALYQALGKVGESLFNAIGTR